MKHHVTTPTGDRVIVIGSEVILIELDIHDVMSHWQIDALDPREFIRSALDAAAFDRPRLVHSRHIIERHEWGFDFRGDQMMARGCRGHGGEQ